jgi:hypothetical protein
MVAAHPVDGGRASHVANELNDQQGNPGTLTLIAQLAGAAAH